MLHSTAGTSQSADPASEIRSDILEEYRKLQKEVDDYLSLILMTNDERRDYSEKAWEMSRFRTEHPEVKTLDRPDRYN